MEWILILEKGFWCAWAAIGFAILFNVPKRVLPAVWLLAALGGITSKFLLEAGANPILSTLAGSALIGVLTIRAAHSRHAPPLVFSIPAVIPMVPGVFAYRTMLGVIHLTGNPASERYAEVLAQTVSNGMNTFFIVLCLAVGGALPFLITRKESAKKLRFFG